jgi:hypothetical protein
LPTSSQAAGLDIGTGGEQPRGGDDDRIPAFRVDEVADLLATVRIVAGDPHDIARRLLHQIGILVDERLAHACGVLNTCSRICPCNSHRDCTSAGVMNLVQMSRSERSFLFMRTAR